MFFSCLGKVHKIRSKQANKIMQPIIVINVGINVIDNLRIHSTSSSVKVFLIGSLRNDDGSDNDNATNQ